jgi:hypothetical protein
MLNPVVKGRRRTPAEWEHSEWCLADDDLRDLYVGGRPRTFWEAHRASVLVLVVLAVSLVAWLVWGGRG